MWGPLLAAVREWLAWMQFKSVRESVSSIVAPAGLQMQLRRDAEHLGIATNWQLYLSPTMSHSSAAYLRLIGEKVSRRIAGGFSWVADHLRPLRFPEASERIRVLFVDYYPHSTLIVLPLWQHLQKSTRYELLYAACRGKVTTTLREHGVAPYVNLERLPTPRHNFPEIKRIWRNWIREFVIDHWFNKEMACTVTLERVLVESCNDLFYSMACRSRLSTVFERFHPEIVVNTTGTSVEARNAELLAQQFGAKSFHVQHGLYEPDPLRSNSQSDYICCWGQMHCDLLNKHPSRSRLLVTGSPKHDDMWQRLAHVQKQEKPLIAYFSSRADGRVLTKTGYETHMRAIAETARVFPDWEFVVKLHPVDYYPFDGPALLELRGLANVRVSKTEDTYELLKRSSVAVTYASTVAFEAMGFATRLVFLNLTDLPDWIPVQDFKMIRIVRTSKDLITVLAQEVAHRHEPQPGLAAVLLLDGKACHRIENLMLQAIRPHSSKSIPQVSDEAIELPLPIN